jgi:iron-sulfur cluster repair protein YtfE (RIC family)
MVDVEKIKVFNQATIRMLTNLKVIANEFVAPEVACNSLKLLYHKLKGVEEDLLEYIQVEEKAFFPKILSTVKTITIAT